MRRLWWLILGLFLSTNAMASWSYSATLEGQYTGSLPTVTFSTAQQKW